MIAGAMLILGLFFFTVGVIGVMRLPDVKSRLHASGKVATLGFLGLLIGGGLIMPALLPRLLLLGVFFLISAPAASHAIAISQRNQYE
jgi:multicomponent Na+:H+ antiporter subunit G